MLLFGELRIFGIGVGVRRWGVVWVVVSAMTAWPGGVFLGISGVSGEMLSVNYPSHGSRSVGFCRELGEREELIN